ncbi:MAG: AZOBR_p60025 family cell surface glycopolymer formation protein [Acidobacteriota bacterium]
MPVLGCAPLKPIPVAYLALVLAFLGCFAQFHRRNTGFTTLISFGDQFFEQQLPAVRAVPHYTHPGAGYDGQFYAQMAVDPLLRDPNLGRALDTPAYRARRILFSWTAYLLGLGEPGRVLRAYGAQNLIAWVALAWLMTRWLPPDGGRHLMAWVGCLFAFGLVYSARHALLEGPSMLLLAAAIAAIERGRPLLGAAVVGVAGLGRETNILAGAAPVTRLPRSARALRSTAAVGLLVTAPFLAWSLYVRSVFPGFSYGNPGSFGWPLHAYFSEWAVALVDLRQYGWSRFAHYDLYSLVALTTQAGFLAATREWGSPWWRMGAAYGALLVFLGAPIWEGYPGAAPRVLLPMTFAFNVLVVRSRWFWPLAALGNLSVLHSVEVLEVPWVSDLL